MPRLIVKIPYTKGRARKTSAHLKNYVRYMDTREGADKPLPPNFRQKENYTQYIASRPRAERVSDHALFSGADEPVVLSQAVKEVANHPGNVWKLIISLRREDAEQLGCDNAKAWKSLLSAYAVEMAQAMKIPLEQFRWYAAFHDEGHHPHVHMACYSADGKSGFLTKEGLAKIKSGLAGEIFRQELTEIYSRQTQCRDALTKETGAALEQLVQRIAEQGNIYAQYYLLHLDDFRDQLVRQGVVRLFHHLRNLFLEQLPPAGQGVKMGTDHKLRRKLREKKAAQGHKRDDHEPVMTS